MPKVKFTNDNVTIEVPEGANLRKEAMKAKVQLYRGVHRLLNCHGFGQCGSCAVHVKKGVENTSAKGLLERIRLALSFLSIGHEHEIRLACQTKVQGDIEVETRPTQDGEKFW